MVSSRTGRRFICIALLSLWHCFTAGDGWAQGFQTLLGSAQESFSGVTVVPWAKVGYQSLAVNLNLAIPDVALPDPARLDVHPLDLQLKSPNMCIGAAGLSVQRENVFLYAVHRPAFLVT